MRFSWFLNRREQQRETAIRAAAEAHYNAYVPSGKPEWADLTDGERDALIERMREAVLVFAKMD